MMQRASWRDFSTSLSIASVMIAPVAVAIPDPYSKAVFALSVGFANAAVIALKQSNGAKPAEEAPAKAA